MRGSSPGTDLRFEPDNPSWTAMVQGSGSITHSGRQRPTTNWTLKLDHLPPKGRIQIADVQFASTSVGICALSTYEINKIGLTISYHVWPSQRDLLISWNIAPSEDVLRNNDAGIILPIQLVINEPDHMVGKLLLALIDSRIDSKRRNKSQWKSYGI
jgi:hypothetical protein